jgi:hypothetical protein
VMATLIDADGTEKQVFPRNPKRGFDLKQLYELIDCTTVEMITLRDGRTMWMDEDGKYNEALTLNGKATQLFHGAGGMPDDFVVGKVLVCSKGEVK